MVVSLTVRMDTVDLRNAADEFVTGRHVDNLQGLLKGTRTPAWDPGPIDGLGGPMTRQAVVAFQADTGLEADAIVGPLTWGELVPFPRLPPQELPPDDLPRTTPVDATGEFSGLGPQPSFEVLIAEVVAEVVRRHPGDPFAEGGPERTDTAARQSGNEGVILVRREVFGDDALAGHEYTVNAEDRGGEWVVTSASVVRICRRGADGELCV